MRSRTLFLSAFAFALLASLLLAGRRTPVAARAASAPAPATVAVPAPDAEAQARAEEAYASQARAHMEELAKMEAEQKKQSRAAVESVAARAAVQSRRDAAWSIVISTNRQTYQALRQKIKQSRDHSVHCVICDGNGTMPFCVLCEGTGKCPACQGTGKLYGDQHCPVCFGKGTCHLCFGLSRMACPFCDDGTIYAYTPAPTGKIPLPEAAGPQSATRKEVAQNAQTDQSVEVDQNPEPAESPATRVAAAAQRDEYRPRAARPRHAPPPPKESFITDPHSRDPLLVGLVLVFSGILIVPRLAPAIGRVLNGHSEPLAAISTEARAADAGFCEFLRVFNQDNSGTLAVETAETQIHRAMSRFFEIGAERIAAIRNLFNDINSLPDEVTRQNIVSELRDQIRSFWGLCEAPELKQVGRLAMVLEGLLKQVGQAGCLLTPSILRTGAAAINQLEKFARQQAIVDWPASGLPRFLVVDADPTCRLAAWSPLKQAFNEPDIARAGRAALELAAGKAYDVIFLDVDMPGLNEVCARIHQTKLNFNTPIVFVTSHDDFDRLAASISPGGHDLIGKPFLAFEITAKALTLVLRAGGPRRENFLPRMPIPVAAVAGEAAIS